MKIKLKYVIYTVLILTIPPAIVLGICWAEKQREDNLMKIADEFVSGNDGKANVLFIAPKDASLTNPNYLIIIEGPINKKRTQIMASALPIPGEIWGVRNDKGELKLTERLK